MRPELQELFQKKRKLQGIVLAGGAKTQDGDLGAPFGGAGICEAND